MNLPLEYMKIIKYPNDILTTPCLPVEINDEVEDFVWEMVKFMKGGSLWGTVTGLAANQVGKNWRIFVLNTGKDPYDAKIYINPEMPWMTKAPKNIYTEGCYSLTDNQFYHTNRAPSIRLKWQDIDRVWHEERFNGVMAQVIQHEYDHLEGHLCVPKDMLDANQKS